MDLPENLVPDINGPLIAMLLQFYEGADELTKGVPAMIPEGLAVLAVMDLTWLFLQYVHKTEVEHGGNFPEFLQNAAWGAYSVLPWDPGPEGDAEF